MDLLKMHRCNTQFMQPVVKTRWSILMTFLCPLQGSGTLVQSILYDTRALKKLHSLKQQSHSCVE